MVYEKKSLVLGLFSPAWLLICLVRSGNTAHHMLKNTSHSFTVRD